MTAQDKKWSQRVTQASDLKLQGRLDRLRWELVQTVQGRLQERMQALRADRPSYRDWLQKMLADAAELLPKGELAAEVNSEDLAWLAAEWPDLVEAATPGRDIRLADKPTWGNGGVRIRTIDNRAQVDNRFEGRMSRLEARIQRVILQQLFPTDMNASARSGGPQCAVRAAATSARSTAPSCAYTCQVRAMVNRYTSAVSTSSGR